MGAGGLRGKREHGTELGESCGKAQDQGGSRDKRSRGAWLQSHVKGGSWATATAFLLDQLSNYSACSS